MMHEKNLTFLIMFLQVLFTNPTWLFLVLSGTVESAAIVAFSVFLPKVIQFQFNQSLVMAAIWSGIHKYT